jgi:hypothetical protein
MSLPSLRTVSQGLDADGVLLMVLGVKESGDSVQWNTLPPFGFGSPSRMCRLSPSWNLVAHCPANWAANSVNSGVWRPTCLRTGLYHELVPLVDFFVESWYLIEKIPPLRANIIA